MKKNEAKSARGKKTRGGGRPIKIVQKMVDGSESSHDQYFPSSASLKYFVGEPPRYTFRSKVVDNQGKEDEDGAPIQNQNVSAKRLPKLNLKRKALKFLHSEKFNDDNLISMRVDVEENVSTKRAQKTSVANFKEMAGIMNPGSSRDVTENVNTKCASITNRGSLRDVKDDDDDEREVGANVAENVVTERAENTSIARGLNVTVNASLTNRGLCDVKVDDDDETESSMHSVFGNVKGGGADHVAENVATENTSIARSFNFTEVASMMNRCSRDVEDDDEIESSKLSGSVNVKGYYVKQEVATLVEKIIKTHGDIGKECEIECRESRGHFIELMCSVYKKLEDTSLKKITEIEIDGMLSTVDFLRNAKFDVEWLYQRLHDISRIKNLCKDYDVLKKEEGKKKELIVKKEKKIDWYKEKLANLEAEVVVLKSESDKVERETKSLMKKGFDFWKKSLVHGLVV